MSKMQFLGGTKDGLWLSVAPYAPSIVTTEGETYERREYGTDQLQAVYVLKGWQWTDIFDRLINGSRVAEGGQRGAQRIGNVQRFPAPVHGRPEANESEIEARMVADMARKAQQAGLRFTNWPIVERLELTLGRMGDPEPYREARPGETVDVIELRASVVAIPR